MNLSKVILLDLDGVVYHNAHALRYVANKTNKYVHKTLPQLRNVQEAHEFNEKLYTTYGHSFLGLTALKRHLAPSFENYQDYIYDKDTMEYVRNYRHDALMLTKGMETRKFLEAARVSGLPVYLFSNAPERWCKEVLDVLGIGGYIAPQCILSSDHALFHDGNQVWLKPERELFVRVEAFLKHTFRDSKLKITYVDDSFINLTAVIGNDTWKPIWYHEGLQFQSPQLITTTNLSHLKI